jgi:hypothetical protein
MAAGCRCCCLTTPVQDLLLLQVVLAFCVSSTLFVKLRTVVNTYRVPDRWNARVCCWNAEQRADRSSI